MAGTGGSGLNSATHPEFPAIARRYCLRVNNSIVTTRRYLPRYCIGGQSMSAKVFFLTGLLGIGGYVGYTATSYDPAVVPYSKAEVQGILAGAKTTLPDRKSVV